MNPYDIIPPQSADAEQSLLGQLLIGGQKAWDAIADIVTEADFYLDSHRRVFGYMRKLSDDSKPIDILTVADAMEAANQAENLGGIGWLGEMANSVHSTANIKSHARIVAEKSRLRGLLAYADEVTRLALAEGAIAEERIDTALASLLTLAEKGVTGSEPSPIAEALDAVLSRIEDRMNGRVVPGIHTGFADIDYLLDGMKTGDLIIVAGRPSMGKTALALNIAENVALDGNTVLVFSLEMGHEQLASRSLASLSGIDGKKLAKGDIDECEWDQVGMAIAKLKDMPLIVDQSVSLSIAQMRARARRLKRTRGLGLIVIDYLQLMKGEGNTRNEELGDLTRGLKLMARDLDVPIVCLSQLSRKVEERADKRPMLSDLRESGAIEQDADVVMMVYRDEYYTPETPWKGIAEVLIRKNRMGACGDAKLVFRAECSRFHDADRTAVAQAAAASKPQKPRRGGFDG